MWGHVLAVTGLGLLCGLWVVFQRWMARIDPEQPAVEDDCGSCSSVSCGELPRKADKYSVDRGRRSAHPS